MVGLKEFFERNPNVRVVIFAGKGGLGKTTSSAALSYYMAKQGKRVLCFSTDPQASLSDIFERDIYGKGVIEIAPNLHVVEIDADKKIAEYQEEIRRKIKDMYKIDEIPKEIDEYISSAAAEPAMYESATYDAMADLVAKEEYDLYVFDMPPFGHGVRMVAMAEILGKWVEKITEARKMAKEYEEIAATLRGGAVSEDMVLQELQDINNKIGLFTKILTDRTRTAFFMVIIPEKMAILDTERAVKMFKELNMELSGIIVNQVYPPDLLKQQGVSEFIVNKIKMQSQYLDEIKRKFGKYLVGLLPMYSQEPKGLEMLSKVAEDLMNSPLNI
jgi:arsenite-transporting ATPase